MKRAIAALVLACACGSVMAGTLSTANWTVGLSFNIGMYLDLTPTSDIKVYSIDTRITTGPAGSPVTLYVYTCNTGTYVGNDATAANWTQVASATAYSNGNTELTRFIFNPPLNFAANVTKGVMLWSPNGHRYTGGTTQQQTFTNADLTLFSERVRNALFAGTPTTPRVFAGNVNYTLAGQIEGAGAVEPYFVPQGCNALLTVTVVPATSPPSTGIAVTADLSSIDGSVAQPLFDDGTNGDQTPGDGVYSFLAPVPDTVAVGVKAIPFTIADQTNLYNSNRPINLNVQTDQVPGFTSLPRGHQNNAGAGAGINTLVRDLGNPRTAQMVYIADELKSIPVGAKIDSMSFRLQSNATNNPPPSWPATDLHYDNYDIRLSKLPPGVTVANMSLTSFTANIDAGSSVVVRSGPLTIPANSFGAGAANPAVNPWNEWIIDFATPYVYDGQDLVITVTHNGHNVSGDTRFLDAVVTTHAGFGTRFRCIAANAYNATDGGAATTQTILRLKYHTDLSASIDVSPNVVEQNCDTLITVQVTPGTNPPSTGTIVRADLSSLGGSPNMQLFDDGTNGDVTPNDNIYSLLQTVPGSQTTGTFRVPVIVEDDQCRIDEDAVVVTVVAPLSGIVTVTPPDPPAGCPVLIEVAVTPAICSTSTGIAVIANLNAIGGSDTQPLFDNGTNGDVTPNDMVYSYLATIPGTQGIGLVSNLIQITDNEGHQDFPSYEIDVSSPFKNAVAATTPIQASVGDTVVVTLDLNIQPCAASTNRVVTANFGNVGGSFTQAMLDNGVPPDAVAGDNIYSASLLVPAPACTSHELPITAQDDQGHFDSFTALLLVAPSGDPILFDGGPMTTHPGGGANGFDLSALQNVVSLPNIPIPMNTLGWGGPAPNRGADDFVICDPAGWNISTVTIYAYQTGSTLNSSITSVTLRIWDGPPGAGGSNIVFGDDVTDRMQSTCWTGIYRATLTDPLGTTRPVMSCVVNVGTVLPPGRYWIDFSATGSVASGPFTPPVTRLDQPNTGNALGSATGATYAALVDTGLGGGAAYRSGLPFLVRGTANPFVLGDMDCNGVVNGLDVSPFANVLIGADTDPSRIFVADVNQDGVANLDDIAAMTTLLLN